MKQISVAEKLFGKRKVAEELYPRFHALPKSPNGDPVEGRDPSISADGRFVAFTSTAAIIPTDTNGRRDIYVRDRQAGTVQLCSTQPDGTDFLGDCFAPFMSGDGRYVAFIGPGESSRPDSITVLHPDVYIHDRIAGTTVEGSIGVEGDALGASDFPSLSTDGRFFLFRSHGANLVADDTNFIGDFFLRDRGEVVME